MSLLVRYTLKDAAHHATQAEAMKTLVAGLSAEGVPVHYSCFATEDPTAFLGLLEFENDSDFKVFQESAAFATYRDTVGPTFAGPPQTTKIEAIASTKA